MVGARVSRLEGNETAYNERLLSAAPSTSSWAYPKCNRPMCDSGHRQRLGNRGRHQMRNTGYSRWQTRIEGSLLKDSLPAVVDGVSCAEESARSTVLAVQDLTKRYGRLTAVDNISFQVTKGGT